MVVIPSLIWDAANILKIRVSTWKLSGNLLEICLVGFVDTLKMVIPSTTCGVDSETDMHCRVVIFLLLCNEQVFNCQLAVMY